MLFYALKARRHGGESKVLSGLATYNDTTKGTAV